MPAENQVFNQDILIAVDESENAERAVSYVARLLEGRAGFRVTILHIIQDPEEDYFPDPAEKDKWLDQYRARMAQRVEVYRGILLAAGFAPERVSVRTPTLSCPSLAECILAERDEGKYATIVVGRKGISRKERFLFGSVSSKIVNHASNCTVWVVS
jgi:nucleotide-binding universal stress UspA family protein